MSNTSSNINEVIRAVLNSFFFVFSKKISHAQKSTKKHKKHKKHQKAPKAPETTKSTKSTKKHTNAQSKNANKKTKIKNALKKHLKGKE